MTTQPITPERLITVKEAATYLNVAPLTVRRMIYRGDLTGHKIGPRLVRIALADVLALTAR